MSRTWKKLSNVSLSGGEGETSEPHHPIISFNFCGFLNDGLSILLSHFIHCKTQWRKHITCLIDFFFLNRHAADSPTVILYVQLSRVKTNPQRSVDRDTVCASPEPCWHLPHVPSQWTLSRTASPSYSQSSGFPSPRHGSCTLKAWEICYFILVILMIADRKGQYKHCHGGCILINIY